MNINLKLSGVAESIVESMIQEGYATSKTEAIRLALITFNDRQRTEDNLVARKMQKTDDDIKSGKVRLIDSNEALGDYAKYLK